MTHLFNQVLSEQPFLIMAHRGTWGGNVIENTRQSVELAFRSGADVAEIDVCRTKDGVYYLYHDGNEEYLLGDKRPFMEWTSTEIDQVIYRNSIGEQSGYRVEKLIDFLDWLPPHYLVNIDRSWHYWDDPGFFGILRDSGKLDQLLLKSPVDAQWVGHLTPDVQFMPIIHHRAELDLLNEFPEINLIALELIVKNDDSEFLDASLLQEWREEGLILMANSETLNDFVILFNGYDDNRALFEGEEQAWGQLLDLGIDLIQTDWPYFLDKYRQELKEAN